MDNFPFRRSLWRKRGQPKMQRYCCDGECRQGRECPQVDGEMIEAGLIVAAIIGATAAVILALTFTFSWLI